MDIDVTQEAPDLEAIKRNEARTSGKFSYKYLMATKEKDEDPALNYTRADVQYPTILPVWKKPDDYPYDFMDPEVTYCSGSVAFIRPEWEDMPQIWNIAWGLNDLKCKRVLGAKLVHCNDPCHYTDCYRLR